MIKYIVDYRYWLYGKKFNKIIIKSVFKDRFNTALKGVITPLLMSPKTSFSENCPVNIMLLPENCYNNSILHYNCVEKLIVQHNIFDKIGNLSLGTKVSCLESIPKSGGKYIRAAGTFGILINKTLKYCCIKMPSLAYKVFCKDCFAYTTPMSNKEHFKNKFKKAGTKVNLGIRPKVRGVAKNAVDHPHGSSGKSHIGKKSTFVSLNFLKKGVKTSTLKKRLHYRL